MQNNDLISYNLTKISLIDEELKSINEEKDNYIKKLDSKLKINKMIEKCRVTKIEVIMLVLISLICYIFVKKFVYSCLLSIVIIVFINLIFEILLDIYKIDKDSINKLTDYAEKISNLLCKRNTYINLYNYSKYGKQALYDNIRKKIKEEKYCDYDKCLDDSLFDMDSYEYLTLVEMNNKEKTLIKNIKEEVILEISSPNNRFNLSKEELNLIANKI